MYLVKAFFIILAIKCFVSNTKADRTSLKIYQKIQSENFCFRRLNATNQIGCSTTKRGNIGVIHYVEDAIEDIEWITKKGPDSPYAVALPIKYFNMRIMTMLKESGRANGILLLKNGAENFDKFSTDSSCPNEDFEMYINTKYARCEKVTWNSNNITSGMMFVDWGMPIFLVSVKEDIDNIISCYTKFNKPDEWVPKPWPLCSAQLKSEMSAAKDTETCMRRSNHAGSVNNIRYCDPLKDSNIITTLFAVNKSETYSNRSILVLATKLDAFSMFDLLSPGAHNTITGLVTFLSVANTLASVKDEISQSTNFSNVLMAIFNGESFGYIGSSRVVYDMKNEIFPIKLDDSVPIQPSLIKLEHISHFIEINQMKPDSKKQKVWAHYDPISSESGQNETIDNMIKIFKQVSSSSKYKIMGADNQTPLPPSSLQSFLKEDSNIAGVVLTDHKDEYSNKYYNSFYDTNDSLSAPDLHLQLQNISSSVSRSIYQLLTGKQNDQLTANETIISELLKCYLNNSLCEFFQQLSGRQDPSQHNDPFPLYVSVGTGNQRRNSVTLYTRHVMAKLTGNEQPIEKQFCMTNLTGNQLQYYDWIASRTNDTNGTCVESTSMYTEALSPAFVLNDWKSSKYSTWTESVWSEVDVRIFLQPSQYQELLTLITGIVILLISFIIVYIFKKRSIPLFGPRQLAGC